MKERTFPDDFPDGFYLHKGNNLYSVDLPMDIPFCKKVNLFTGEVTTQLEMVPVVRCKDCKHYWKNKPSDDVPVCLASPGEDAYCSESERREDG